MEEEKQTMADFGSTDSGAALGEILGAALKAKQQEKDDERIRRRYKPAAGDPVAGFFV